MEERVQRQAGTNTEVGVAERPEIMPHAFLVQQRRPAAVLLVAHLPVLRHEAELIRAVI